MCSFVPWHFLTVYKWKDIAFLYLWFNVCILTSIITVLEVTIFNWNYCGHLPWLFAEHIPCGNKMLCEYWTRAFKSRISLTGYRTLTVSRCRVLYFLNSFVCKFKYFPVHKNNSLMLKICCWFFYYCCLHLEHLEIKFQFK